MEEPTSDAPDGPARPKLARALTASIRRQGDKGTLTGRIVTAGLAVALTCALAIGIGAVATHTKSAAAKSPDAAARRSPTTSPLAKTVPPSGAPKTYTTVPAGPAGPVPVPVGAAATRPKVKIYSRTPGKRAGTKTMSAAETAAQKAAATRTIVSYADGRCIDVTNKGQTGVPLQTWDCDPVVDWKRWTFYSDNTIRSMGRCMTVAGGSANGTPIELASCNGGASQRFVLKNSLDLVNIAADKCVDVKGKQTANGTPLQLWDCGGTSNQKWHTGA
ncbi:ricin-type beta-trefoil lectin domain protein [Actinoallomurus purpureus]|uniref:ricin-type beta-trefoil lectin domain protein n=1 Tax=Actinoallomurus purpureus TaxID=478114 RepID=UPI002093488D|nr:RICIN domain-containing protein [Actinoallomurus purpureus]MCO6004193.1 ricin-type beta-trefoil lectin domain protein [Actinoallomurus purpureus]